MIVKCRVINHHPINDKVFSKALIISLAQKLSRDLGFYYMQDTFARATHSAVRGTPSAARDDRVSCILVYKGFYDFAALTLRRGST